MFQLFNGSSPQSVIALTDVELTRRTNKSGQNRVFMLLKLFLFASVCASVSFTVSEAYIFKAFREWTCRKSHFLGKLVSCGYCTSHYIAFFIVAIYQPKFIDSGFALLDYFFSALIISWFGSFMWILMCLLMKKAGK